MAYVVVLAMLGILGSLASALVFLMRDKGKTNRTANALTWRVGLSIALFLFILLAHALGLIETTGIPTSR